MWEAISQVGSGLTLVAFLAAAGAAILRRYLLARERQLLATPENERGAVVQALNDAFLVPSFSIDPNTLSQTQRYTLLLEQIRDRSRRFYVAAIVIIIIALIIAGVTIVAMSRSQFSAAHVSAFPEEEPVPKSTKPREKMRELTAAATPAASTDSAPHTLPAVMTRLLTPQDLQNKSIEELTLMRNEIYARLGRKFRRAELQSYFNAQTWYQPKYEPEDFPISLLTPTQRHNIDLIVAAERQRGYR